MTVSKSTGLQEYKNAQYPEGAQVNHAYQTVWSYYCGAFSQLNLKLARGKGP